MREAVSKAIAHAGFKAHMIEIRRILCPIDFSDASRHALEHAVVIAGWYRSRIVALHVGHPMILLSPLVLFTDPPGAILPTEPDRQQLRQQLREWLVPAEKAGLETEALFDEGNSVTRILERARSLPADLIVMGTHGRGGFERLILGSVTERILRKAKCPVLTVPPPATASSKLPFKQMLCPIDFSEPSISALQFAFSIAQESDARLTIQHVFEWSSDDQAIAKRSFELSEFRRQWEAETRQRLEGLISDDVRRWCAPEPKLSLGKPYRQILALAEAEHIDLIVMGVHGRNALDLLLFGSTTNHVVQRASCPVLTLKK
jgi:nucleotide-binding universal stress UspA family protein